MYGMVLGLDILKREGVTINFKTKTARFPKQTGLCLSNDVNIPAQSEMLVLTETCTKLNTIATASVSCNVNAVKLGLIVANSVVTISPTCSKIPIRVMNAHTKPIHLKAGTKLARLQLLDKKDVVVGVNDSSASTCAMSNGFMNGSDSKQNEPMGDYTDVNKFRKHFYFSKSAFTND